MQVSKLSEWVASKLTPLGSLPLWLIILISCLIVTSVTEVASNPATITIFLPILSPLVSITSLFLIRIYSIIHIIMQLLKEAVLKSLNKILHAGFLLSCIVHWTLQVFLTRDAENLVKLHKSSFHDLNPDSNQAPRSLTPALAGSWTELEREKLQKLMG